MKPRVYLETFGCQMNIADTDRAASCLRGAGYEVTTSFLTADIVILNTCSVREKAERKVFSRIGEIRKQRRGAEPFVGVAGCVAQLKGGAIFDSSPVVDMVIGTQAIDRLPSLIERVVKGEERVLDIGERLEGETRSTLVAERFSSTVAFVPIIEGCNKFCTYCIVPFSRGRERSRSAREVIAEVLMLRANGFQEVHLIGQNVNSYRPLSEDGLEHIKGATPFSRLLRAVARTGMERIKFTTSFPRDFHFDIITALNEYDNLCNWVHLPVQSGSDKILKAMRRGYDVADYLMRIEYVRNSKRRIALTTDIIIGFPGETTKDFEDTMRLIERCQYDGIHIFKYSQRSGTKACTLKDSISEEEKTKRFLDLENLQRGIQHKIYIQYLGQRVEVLVEGRSVKLIEDMCGHTTCNKVVNFRGQPCLQGRILEVLITDVKENCFMGKV